MKVLSKKVINTTSYLNFVQTEFIDNRNQKAYWYSAERPNGGKTVMVAALVENKLVLTKEFRIPINQFEWGLPAGLVDDDESPCETARRELKEETNLEIASISGWTPYLTNSAGLTNEMVSIVFCHATGLISQHGNESTEEIQCFLYDKEQVNLLINDSSIIISAKAYLIFERFLSGNLW